MLFKCVRGDSWVPCGCWEIFQSRQISFVGPSFRWATNGKLVVLVLRLFDAWKKGKHIYIYNIIYIYIIPKVTVMNPIARSVKNHPSKWFGGPNCFGMFFRGTPKYQSLGDPSCIHPTLKAEPSVGSGVSKHFLGGFKYRGDLPKQTSNLYTYIDM